ncbi:hypothetical protein HNP25_002075 [Arcicella rosea]|uniref:Uncharacterized protein n=1 Tax=Arcicella rosea TaxID=502909 RepID=A0A841EPW6_9BACT|nr:hypothetical protein [Arcicella rosea]
MTLCSFDCNRRAVVRVFTDDYLLTVVIFLIIYQKEVRGDTHFGKMN